MPNANQCELSRVYVRYTDITNHGGVSEEAIKDNAPFDLVLELEAGQTVFNTGAQYNLLIVLNDLSDSSTTVFSKTQSGQFGDTGWPKPDGQYFWTVPTGVITSTVDDHVFQAIGVMSVGKADPVVDSGQSDLFIITQP
jgi:hypothetical protein